MSGWIKVEKDLATDPRVLRIASRLRNADVTLGLRSRIVVVGALVTLWWYADTHIRDDDTLPIGTDQIDELVGVEGFCDLLPAEWLQVLSPDCVKLVNYLAHNGTSAKQRALTQKRVERLRKRNADVTPVSRRRYSPSVTRPRPREDKTKIVGEPPTPLPLNGQETPPLDLDDSAWSRWVSYRQGIRRPIKPPSINSAQKALAAFGTDQAAVVERSIANGWQGLFPLDRKPDSSAPARTWRPTAEDP